MPPMQLTRVADGLDQPVYVTTPPGDPDSLYVVEKAGTIRIVRGGAVAGTFLDISSRVLIPGEQAEGGLLGLAFAPDYAESGRFFVHLSADDGGDDRVSISEYHRSAGDPDVADPTLVDELLTADHGGWNHVGGMIAFSPADGYLYVAIGDAAAGSPSPARDLDSRLGKILRVDADNPGTPPPGNLPGGDPYVWDWGLRNPWRFSFDRVTGDLYIGDVGQDDWEEIDVEPAGEGNRDYGWDEMEGAHPYNGGSTVGELPTVEYSHAEGDSVIGGYVYRGTQVPCLYGRYLYSDFGTNRFWSFVYAGGEAEDEIELTDDLNPGIGISNIVSFGEGSDGELYVVSISGRVYRIELE
jgi:glucose/arabinose dehydrogenase